MTPTVISSPLPCWEASFSQCLRLDWTGSMPSSRIISHRGAVGWTGASNSLTLVDHAGAFLHGHSAAWAFYFGNGASAHGNRLLVRDGSAVTAPNWPK